MIKKLITAGLLGAVGVAIAYSSQLPVYLSLPFIIGGIVVIVVGIVKILFVFGLISAIVYLVIEYDLVQLVA